MQRLLLTNFLLLFILLPFTGSVYADTESTTPSEEFLLSGDYENFFLNNLQLAATDPKNSYLPLLLAKDINKQFLSSNDLGKDLLGKLLANKELPPLSRDLIVQMLATIEASAGQEYQATELQRKRGIIPSWRIAGSFGEYDQASFYQSFPPEGNIDFSIFMQGLRKDVTWRLLGENICLNNFQPYQWVSPQRGVLYLYTQFKLSEPTAIILEKTGTGSCTFWIDGKESGTADPMQEEQGNTIRFNSAEKLSAGWHRLLLKIYSAQTHGSEIFRLLDPDLNPINNITYDLTALHGTNEFGTKIWKRREPATADLTTAEEALLCQYNHEFDRALSLWQQAINSEPDNPVLHIYYAACAGQSASILPGPLQTSIIQREALKALELDPKAVGALLILGDHERQNKHFDKACSYYKQALSLNPKAIMAHGARIRIALENNWNAEANAWLQELEKIYPDSYLSLLLNSIYANKTGQINKAAKILEKACEKNSSNIIIASDCIRSYFASGNYEKALELINKIPSYYQQRFDLIMLKAEMLSRTGKYTEAEETLKECLQAIGNDPGILRLQGDILFTAKNIAAAINKYSESLQSDTGNYSLRRLLAGLEDKDYSFWQKFTINTQDTIEKFITTHTDYLGSTARLIDQTVLTIENSGGYSNYTHELQAVLTDSGVNKAAIVDTYGELLQARTIIPEKNRSLEPIILKGAKKITMPAVAPGAIIEHSYLNEIPTPPDHKLRFPKWYFRSPNSQESFLFSQYIVRVPKGVDFAYATRNLDDNIEFSTSEDEDGTRYFIWTGKNMPEAIHEEGTPAISSTLPYVAVASRQSWNDVHSSMITSYLGKTIPTLAIKKKVQELTADCKTAGAKISNIYNYVNSEITPSGSRSPAGHIFLQKSGNKRNLLLAMLHSAGIKADLVAVRPPENILYDPIWKLPSDNNFIDYLIRCRTGNENDIWLDPRARYAQAGEIGEDFCGGTGFILGLRKCEFVTIPAAPKNLYTIERRREYHFSDDATALTGSINYSGTRGWEFKENMIDLNHELRLGVIENILSKSLLGITVSAFELPNLTTPGTSFTINYTATVPDFLRENTSGQFGVNLALPKIELLPKHDANNRKTPYHLSNFVCGHDRYTYILPEDAVIKKLPEDQIIRSKFGYYSLSFTQENNNIILERKYNFQPQIIALNDWNDYHQLSSSIDHLENTYIWFEKRK